MEGTQERGPAVVYELRKWSEDADCLYTEDQRVKDIALHSPDLRIVGTYFRSAGQAQPFAWDIVGERSTLAGITRTFTEGPGRRV